MWSLALTNAKEVWPALAVEGNQRSRPNRSTSIRLTALMFVKYASTTMLIENPSLSHDANVEAPASGPGECRVSRDPWRALLGVLHQRRHLERR
jgi:hypothetical protein